MLRNELQEIEKLLFAHECSGGNILTEIDITLQFNHICKAWEHATFSGMPEHSLLRYFHYHLEGISKLSDTLSNLPDSVGYEDVQYGLLSLVDRLKLYYSPYFNLETNAPVAYHKRLLGQLADSIGLIRESLQTAGITPSLKTCLLKWLDEMSESDGNVQYSFRSLTYLEYLVRQLPRVNFHTDETNDKLINLLSSSNFNHLSFFVFRQHIIRETLSGLCSASQQLNYLLQQKADVLACPEEKKILFDFNWPSLKTMMGEWLNEEIRLAEFVVSKQEAMLRYNSPKMPLDLSVSQLACLIRLFFEEGKFAVENLKVVFNFFASSYRTKRQPVISPGSLSKEFYSIDQQTAARVRDLLKKMIERINRNFFPVMVAAGIAIHVYPGMR